MSELISFVPTGAASNEFLENGFTRDFFINITSDFFLVFAAYFRLAGATTRAALWLHGTNIAFEGGVGTLRAYEFFTQENNNAAGFEALLRLIGVSLSATEKNFLKKLKTLDPRGLPDELLVLRAPARDLLENEGRLLTQAEGLQSRLSGTFENVLTGTKGDPAKTYLWTIDERGINLALEKTPFPTPRGNVVHSNLSKKASIAGEAWFTGPNAVTINAGSGRFGFGSGATQSQWDAAVKFWEGLGYKVNAVPFNSR